MYSYSLTHSFFIFLIYYQMENYTIIENETGAFVKVRSQFNDKETGELVKLTHTFRFADDANIPNFQTRAGLQNPDFLRKNIEEVLVKAGRMEPVNLKEIASSI